MGTQLLPVVFLMRAHGVGSDRLIGVFVLFDFFFKVNSVYLKHSSEHSLLFKTKSQRVKAQHRTILGRYCCSVVRSYG